MKARHEGAFASIIPHPDAPVEALFRRPFETVPHRTLTVLEAQVLDMLDRATPEVRALMHRVAMRLRNAPDGLTMRKIAPTEIARLAELCHHDPEFIRAVNTARRVSQKPAQRQSTQDAVDAPSSQRRQRKRRAVAAPQPDRQSLSP